MRDFYERFYAIVADSPVNAQFCERTYGRNLAQHGFASMIQIDKMLEVLNLSAEQRVLDLGCGNGMISEYISDQTGAHVTGLDYITLAIEQAQARTAAKADRLAFQVADFNTMTLTKHGFDVLIAIDTLYFVEDLTAATQKLAAALRPGGQMAMLYSHGWEPHVPKESFDASTLPPDRTPMGQALQALSLPFRTWDFTDDDYRLAQIRQKVLAQLHDQFEAEDCLFIYDNRLGEANGVAQSIEDGLHARYLYHVQLPE